VAEKIDDKYLHSEVTSKIIQAFYSVYNYFRFGFPKSVYIQSMLIEMRKLGLDCECDKIVKIYYDKQEVGECISEIIVNKCVVLNIETKEEPNLEDELKVYYVLRVSEIVVGLFLNFGKEPFHKRKYYPHQ